MCVPTSAHALTQVSDLTSVSLGFSINKMGIVSNSEFTELRKRLNDLMHVKCLTEIKAQKITV